MYYKLTISCSTEIKDKLEYNQSFDKIEIKKHEHKSLQRQDDQTLSSVSHCDVTTS